jgi:hypothetical protein
MRGSEGYFGIGRTTAVMVTQRQVAGCGSEISIMRRHWSDGMNALLKNGVSRYMRACIKRAMQLEVNIEQHMCV